MRENLKHFVEKYRDIEDLGLKWDLVKMEIRGFTVKFSKTKARKRRAEETFLQKRINELFLKAEKVKQQAYNMRTQFYSGSSRKNNGSQNSRHYP